MFGFLKKKAEANVSVTELKAFVSGKAIKIEDVKDGVFSEKILGEGMAIIPSAETITAPCAGEICSVIDTKHAVGIRLNNGMELLIHVGLDTVSMNGEGFATLVKEGDKVKAGQKLIQFDRAKIAEAGFKDTVILVIVANEKELPLDFQYGDVVQDETIIVKCS